MVLPHDTQCLGTLSKMSILLFSNSLATDEIVHLILLKLWLWHSGSLH